MNKYLELNPIQLKWNQKTNCHNVRRSYGQYHSGSPMLQHILWNKYLLLYMWCDQAKWAGTRWYWFLDRANNRIQFPLYFIVLSITKKAISLEPYAQSWWGLQYNIALKLKHTLQMKTELLFFLEFRLILLDRITYNLQFILQRLLWNGGTTMILPIE